MATLIIATPTFKERIMSAALRLISRSLLWSFRALGRNVAAGTAGGPHWPFGRITSEVANWMHIARGERHEQLWRQSLMTEARMGVPRGASPGDEVLSATALDGLGEVALVAGEPRRAMSASLGYFSASRSTSESLSLTNPILPGAYPLIMVSKGIRGQTRGAGNAALLVSLRAQVEQGTEKTEQLEQDAQACASVRVRGDGPAASSMDHGGVAVAGIIGMGRMASRSLGRAEKRPPSTAASRARRETGRQPPEATA